MNSVTSGAVYGYLKSFKNLGLLSNQNDELTFNASTIELLVLGNNFGSAYYDVKLISKAVGNGNVYIDTIGSDAQSYVSVDWTNRKITLSLLATSNRVRVYYR